MENECCSRVNSSYGIQKCTGLRRLYMYIKMMYENEEIEVVVQKNLLGITVDNKLTFDIQIVNHKSHSE